ncbi:hypothetical protein [Prevotella jejuni]|uniref:hypothetical protein n=1 Tax=Prevotella jejuni TaxID=1177574 RepID=UPI0028E8E8B1|nr:hypothetical protein [Prevotella jejuni]
MAKKLIFSCLMLLFPISILAQKSVLFDFSKYSKDEEIPFRIEKEGVVLEFSTRSKKLYSPKCSVINDGSCVRLVSDSLLTIKGVSCEITSVTFSIVGDKMRLRVYDDDDKMPFFKEKKGRKVSYRQEWNGNKQSISFTPTTSKGSCITSIKVNYEPVRPVEPTENTVSIDISAAKRATFYYGEKSFVIPKGVIARTYKIVDNVLSVSKTYQENDVLPSGTAVVLEGEEGNYLFKETTKEGEGDALNALRGSDVDTETDGGTLYYVFAKGSNGVGFYWNKPDGKAFQTKAHKAYLVYTPTVATQAKSNFTFDIPLGINSTTVNDDVHQCCPIYNLAGQQVSKDYKGIIIVGGKKYLNR